MRKLFDIFVLKLVYVKFFFLDLFYMFIFLVMDVIIINLMFDFWFELVNFFFWEKELKKEKCKFKLVYIFRYERMFDE